MAIIAARLCDCLFSPPRRRVWKAASSCVSPDTLGSVRSCVGGTPRVDFGQPVLRAPRLRTAVVWVQCGRSTRATTPAQFGNRLLRKPGADGIGKLMLFRSELDTPFDRRTISRKCDTN